MLESNEIQRLAAAISALRPDWPARSLRTFIERNLADRAYGDLAVAFAWIATRTKTETPRLILEAGPWWKACQVDGTTAPRNYRVPCSEHPGETLPCGRCANEAVPARSLAAHHIANARGNLAAAKRDLCSHGVRADACKDRHDQPEPEESK